MIFAILESEESYKEFFEECKDLLYSHQLYFSDIRLRDRISGKI